MERLVLFKLTTEQDRAQLLLKEWNRFRSSGACSLIFDIQESKDRLEDLATRLSAELYCADAEELYQACLQFESELEQLKERVFVDLIAGLQKSNTK